jgi:hypothetical protein
LSDRIAWWLLRDGHRGDDREDVAAEDGRIRDQLLGQAYDLAERTALMPRLEDIGYHVREVRFVGPDGGQRGEFSASVFGRATRGRFIGLPRSHLSRTFFGALENRAEAPFGRQIDILEPDCRRVAVRLDDGSERRFDLVVDALPDY